VTQHFLLSSDSFVARSQLAPSQRIGAGIEPRSMTFRRRTEADLAEADFQPVCLMVRQQA
jgi:hypothetical protein